MNYHFSLAELLSKREWAELFVERCIKVLIILAAVLFCAKLIHVLSLRILTVAKKAKLEGGPSAERDKRLTTLVGLIDTVLRVVLFGVAILMILREFGLDITPLLTGAGIAGVAVGFGAQSLVKDFFSGFFILVEDQIRVGDVVKINSGLSGTVERMELRVTALRDGDGTLHIIPNGQITSVSNMTYDFGQAIVDIPVPYQTDLAKLSTILTTVAQGLEQEPAWKDKLRSRPTFVGIVKLDTDHMVAELTAKTDASARWSVATELRHRALNALAREGIKLPTGLTVHFTGEDMS